MVLISLYMKLHNKGAVGVNLQLPKLAPQCLFENGPYSSRGTLSISYGNQSNSMVEKIKAANLKDKTKVLQFYVRNNMTVHN